MRLWSLHPSYLDRAGLLAVWREGLLAQSVLLKGEYDKCACENGKICVGVSLTERFIYEECFNCNGTGKIKTPYYNHPQLERFKGKDLTYIILYLREIFKEGEKRGYKFRLDKIKELPMTIKHPKLTVTTGQLEYELWLLQEKLKKRDIGQFAANLYNVYDKEMKIEELKPHPLFEIIGGEIEKWEKVKKKN